MEECYAKLTELGLLIQEVVNECMGLPPGFLRDYNNDRSFDFMAALRYFPATEEEDNGITAHEDGNCITFVFQDGVGGLEVLKDDDWIPAEPVDGSIIVNLGDIIQARTENTSIFFWAKTDIAQHCPRKQITTLLHVLISSSKFIVYFKKMFVKPFLGPFGLMNFYLFISTNILRLYRYSKNKLNKLDQCNLV